MNGVAAVLHPPREMNGQQALHPRGEEWHRAWLHPSDGRRIASWRGCILRPVGNVVGRWKHVELDGEVRLAVEAV